MIEIIICAVLAAWAFAGLLWLIDRVTGLGLKPQKRVRWSDWWAEITTLTICSGLAVAMLLK